MDANEIIERRVHHGRRAVGDRPAPAPRSARAHPRRLSRRDRGRRAHDRRHRRPLDVSRSDGSARGLQRRGRVRGDGRAAAALRLVRQRARDVGPARLGDQRVSRGRVGSREPRAVLPLGLRGLGAGRQGPRRRHARWRRRRWRRAEDVGLHVVEPRVLRAVGRDLDRDVRAASLPPVRHDARATRVDRTERAPQRRAEPERDLPRSDVVRRLHGRA